MYKTSLANLTLFTQPSSKAMYKTSLANLALFTRPSSKALIQMQTPVWSNFRVTVKSLSRSCKVLKSVFSIQQSSHRVTFKLFRK